MMKTKTIGALAALLLVPVFASAQDKKEFRYAFEKGQTFTLSLQNTTKLSLSEIPEAFQGLIGDDPINLSFEGDLAAEVVSVKDGKAELKGTWKSMKVKGTMLMNKLDFVHGRAAAGKEEKPEEPADPGLGAFGDPEAQFRDFAQKPLPLVIDEQGRITVKGGDAGGGGQDVSGQFLAFMGLSGPFPKESKGPGDSWESERKISIPSLQGALDLTVKSKTTYAKDMEVEGRDCAVLASTFTVINPKKADEKPDPLTPQIKVDGKGEGRMLFSTKEGRPAGVADTLKIGIAAVFQDPGGGGEMSLKATLQVKQEYQFSR